MAAWAAMIRASLATNEVRAARLIAAPLSCVSRTLRSVPYAPCRAGGVSSDDEDEGSMPSMVVLRQQLDAHSWRTERGRTNAPSDGPAVRSSDCPFDAKCADTYPNSTCVAAHGLARSGERHAARPGCGKARGGTFVFRLDEDAKGSNTRVKGVFTYEITHTLNFYGEDVPVVLAVSARGMPR